jgi:DNA-binding NtrC family response regulator
VILETDGRAPVADGVEATRLGAYDFVEKPLSLAKLLLTVERALETSRLRRENEGLRNQMLMPLDPVVTSRAMQALKLQMEKLAAHDAAILIQGERGTDKEALARWLHENCARRGGPFVTVSPGSIAREHAARALFGSDENGGVQYGLIEQANGGTLFLDEVATSIPNCSCACRVRWPAQPDPLRRAPDAVPIDLRVIAASSQDLDAAVRAGRFRESFTTSSMSCRCRCPRCVSASRDIPSCATTPISSPIATSSHSACFRSPCRIVCATMSGRATCASCATSCSAC